MEPIENKILADATGRNFPLAIVPFSQDTLKNIWAKAEAFLCIR